MLNEAEIESEDDDSALNNSIFDHYADEPNKLLTKQTVTWFDAKDATLSETTDLVNPAFLHNAAF